MRWLPTAYNASCPRTDAIAWLVLVKDQPGSELLRAEAKAASGAVAAVSVEEARADTAGGVGEREEDAESAAPAQAPEARKKRSGVEWRVFTLPSVIVCTMACVCTALLLPLATAARHGCPRAYPQPLRPQEGRHRCAGLRARAVAAVRVRGAAWRLTAPAGILDVLEESDRDGPGILLPCVDTRLGSCGLFSFACPLCQRGTRSILEMDDALQRRTVLRSMRCPQRTQKPKKAAEAGPCRLAGDRFLLGLA
eukprot:SAG11_NODE_5035_length_1684_cov_0.820189_2_plen_252_part_00